MNLVDELKDIFARTIKEVPNLIIVLGAILLIISFISYNNQGINFPTESPKYFLLIFGDIFIVLGIIIHIIYRNKNTRKLKDKTTLKFNSTILTIKIANIQDEINLTSDSAFVLPANDTFVDDCVTDKNTALGSFFNKHHADKIPTFKEELKKILISQNILPNDDEHYKPSTVLILPEEYSIKSKVILVVSSVKNCGIGFQTDPAIISNCIYNLFKETADKRISTFFIPIIGSGHAGLEITQALNLLLLCIKFHTKQFHHPRNINIYVRETDNKKINANFLNSI
ncbi:MAG: macro domain-containing protein [Ignavibacteria bacterium]